MGAILQPRRKLSVVLVGYVPESSLTNDEITAIVLAELGLSLRLSSWIRFTAALPGVHVVPIPGDVDSGGAGPALVS